MKPIAATLTILAGLAASMGNTNAGSVGRHGDWQVNFGQGAVEYLTRSNQGRTLNITCDMGASGREIGIDISGLDLSQSERRLIFSVDARTPFIELRMTRDGFIDRAYKPNRAAFRKLWRKMRGGNLLMVIYPVGKADNFSLRGSAAALDPTPCILGDASHPATANATSKAAKHRGNDQSNNNVVPLLKRHCDEKWPGNFRMQRYCIDRQEDAIKHLIKLFEKHGTRPIYIQIHDLCEAKWRFSSTQDDVNWRMMAYCIDRQIEAATSLGKF